MYNLTQLSGSTGFGDMITVANSFTDGLLINMFIIAVFVVILLSLSIEDISIKVAVSSFITFFVSLALSYAEFTTIYMPIAFLIITAFSLLVMYTTKQ